MHLYDRSRTVSCKMTPLDVIGNLEREWHSMAGIQGEYINRDGFWETDMGGHGSGYRETYDKATDEQVRVSKLFGQMKEVFHAQHQARRDILQKVQTVLAQAGLSKGLIVHFDDE